MRLAIEDQGSINYLASFPCALCGDFNTGVSYDHDKYEFNQVYEYFWSKWEDEFLNSDSQVDFTQALSFTETGPQLSPFLQDSWSKFHRAYVASSARLCRPCNNNFDKNYLNNPCDEYRKPYKYRKFNLDQVLKLP